MGNNVVKEGDVIISRREYLDKLQHFESLQTIIKQQNIETERLKKENKVLLDTNKEMQSKYDTIKEEKQVLEANFSKYEFSPICKSILNINEQIIELEQDIKSFLKTNVKSNFELIEEINKNIKDQRSNMNEYLALLPAMKAKELEELETASKIEQLNFEENVHIKVKSLNELLDKLNQMKEKIPKLIERSLKSVDTELMTNKSVFNDMKSDHVNNRYKKIKAMLLEQENILLKHRLNVSREEKGKQKPFKYNEDGQQYSLIFCNIIEEFVDGRSDYVKIQEVIHFLTNVQNQDVKFVRLGWKSSERSRKLKVMFSCMDPVRVILRNKYKLKDSPFSIVRIYPDKFDNTNTPNNIN